MIKLDLKKIITAWAIAINPSDKQKELAEKRYGICDVCPSKIETFKDQEWSTRCKDCGCPLKSKIFTDKYGECPLGKWDDVDADYFNIKKQKTLI
jgi:hypothetical protein